MIGEEEVSLGSSVVIEAPRARRNLRPATWDVDGTLEARSADC